MSFEKITEVDSHYNDLEKTSTAGLLSQMHTEDLKAVAAVEKVLPEVERTIEKIVAQLQNGGRLFYVGAGTSGRLGVLDASECPPTFGSSPDQVVGLIAGGDTALRHSIENAEDSQDQGWKDLQEYQISSEDFVVGIAASGTTPYVVEALRLCQQNHVPTAGICCNPKSPLTQVSDYPIEVVVGPEFVTGSSRLKAGTAQKLILNMISTITMIRLGRVRGNKMVDMQIKNDKLHRRAVQMIVEETQVSESQAEALLDEMGSVRKAIDWYHQSKS